MEFHLGKTLVLVTSVLALAACGGGGGGGESTTSDANAGGSSSAGSPGGIWLGEVKTVDGMTYEAAGLVTENGELRFITVDEEQTVGTMKVSGPSFSADLTSYAPPGYVFDENGKTTISGSASGTIEPRVRFEGTTVLGGKTASTFNFLFDDTYNRGSSFEKIAGIYSDTDGSYTETFNVSTDGTITGSDTDGCIFNGAFSILNSSYNLYRIKLNVSNCDDLNGDYTGLATLTDLNGSENDTLVVSATGPTYLITGYIPKS